MVKDDIQYTSSTFATSHGNALPIDDIINHDFAVRRTSVGGIDGDLGGSAKVNGTPQPIVRAPVATEGITTDDSMKESNAGTCSFFARSHPLDKFQSTILGNDTTRDGTTCAGQVTAVNGTKPFDGQSDGDRAFAFGLDHGETAACG